MAVTEALDRYFDMVVAPFITGGDMMCTWVPTQSIFASWVQYAWLYGVDSTLVNPIQLGMYLGSNRGLKNKFMKKTSTNLGVRAWLLPAAAIYGDNKDIFFTAFKGVK